jgi:hypothetical protein
MAKTNKTTPEEVVPAEEVTPVEDVTTVVLNQPAPERVDTGHPSRDFKTPLN